MKGTKPSVSIYLQDDISAQPFGMFNLMGQRKPIHNKTILHLNDAES